MTHFQVGDRVQIKGCSGKQRVTHIRGDLISTRYLSMSNKGYNDRRASDYELVSTKYKKKEPQMSKISTLYQTKEETPRYGILLTEDSQGRYVLEMKGSNTVEAFTEDQVKEVVPYTVEVEFAGQGTADYMVPENSLEVGDIVVAGIKLGRVAKIGTKSRSAMNGANMMKVGTTSING